LRGLRTSDCCSENWLMQRSRSGIETPVLTDFGFGGTPQQCQLLPIAGCVSTRVTRLSNSNMPCMPPETWSFKQPHNATFEADVFALGCVAYHILVGDYVPWHTSPLGQHERDPRLNGKANPTIVKFTLAQLQHSRVGAAGQALLHKMLEPDPARRPSLAALLKTDEYLRDAAAEAQLIHHRTDAEHLTKTDSALTETARLRP